MSELQAVFNGAKELPLWGFALRATLLYIALIIGIRWMGHREVSILSGHNYLVAAGIMSLAAVRMVNAEASLTAALLIVFAYSGVNVLYSYLDLKWPKVIDRGSVILIENGQINKKNLLETHVTIDNLLGQLRLKGAHNLSEVTYAVLEPTGKISVIKKSATLPVTRQQMNLPAKYVALPALLVHDGQVDEENLNMLGLDLNWLKSKLAEKGFRRPEEVFVAALQADGAIYVSA
ncbi:MAG: hypothetical protein A4E53_02319 [Pelotomaculum sp. PtaB.Bin104]|nr:MAG: hypothetical protein A4E53_02319 [Pelotomaculum sp. PtaB.Bin104]